MEDAGLGQFTERCAALLTSESANEVETGTQMLKDALGPTDYSRKLQELAAFNGGSVLRVLLGRVLHAPSGRTGVRKYVLVEDYDEPSSCEEKGQGSIDDDCLMVPCTEALLRLTDSKWLLSAWCKMGQSLGR